MAEQIRYKNVVTRLAHQCFACLQTFPTGTEMNRSTNVSDGEIYTIYTCKTCEKIIRYFDREDYNGCFDEGCVLEAAQNDNRFKPSFDNLPTDGLIEEYLRFLEGSVF